MRSLSLFALVICLVMLVGCASGARPAPQGAPLAAAPAVQPADVPQTGAAPGERVIKVIRLPKGQTPYDLPGA